MDAQVAEKLSLLMLRLCGQLDDSLALVRDTCPNATYEEYRRTIGNIIASIHLEISERIYQEHPSLRPKQLDGPYEVDPQIYEPRFYDRKK